MIVSVVSPAAPDSVERLFADFTATTGQQLTTNGLAWDRGLQTFAEPIVIDKSGGGEQAHLFWGFVQGVEPDDKPALKALSLILSDRIVFDIREAGAGVSHERGHRTQEKQSAVLHPHGHAATQCRSDRNTIPRLLRCR